MKIITLAVWAHGVQVEKKVFIKKCLFPSLGCKELLLQVEEFKYLWGLLMGGGRMELEVVVLRL